MKKIIIALCFLASFKATAQKIDTSITRCNAARINNVYVSCGYPATTDTATHLGVFNYVDDLKGNCVVNYVLLNKDKNIVNNSYTLTAEQYNNWNGSVVGLLSIIGEILRVTFR